MLRFLKAALPPPLVSIIVLAIVWIAACASPKPKSNPMHDQSAALGVHLKMRAPVRFISHEPDIVVFARVEEGVELTDSYEIYGSTYAHDGRAYLMNVEPGAYVAVAAIYDTESTEPVDPNDPQAGNVTTTTTWRNYFSRELIDQTRVSIRPGEFVFMGNIVANQSMVFGEGDDCQRHFMVLIEDDRSGWTKSQSGERSIRLDLHEKDTGPAARHEFLSKTRDDFMETGWITLIDSAIAKAP
jgi:hypothetical protein